MASDDEIALMEMPSPCSRCGEWFELNDMWGSDYQNPSTGSQVECVDCHRAADTEDGASHE